MLATACTVVMSLSLLASCGEGDESVSRDDLRSALLVADDLGDAFAVSDDDGASGDDLEWGCLFDFEEDLEAAAGDDEGAADITASFETSHEPNMPGVIEYLVLADTEDDAEQALSKVADMIGRCHSVDSDDEDGTHWHFSVDSDRVAWANGVDQQVNMTATGTVGLSGLEIPISMTFSLMRVERVTVMVVFMDMASDVEQARRDVIRVAMRRVMAAIDGEGQPDPAGVLDDYPIGKEFGALLEAPTGV